MMPQSTLVETLIGKVESLAGVHHAYQVVRVRVQLGRYTAIIPEHLRTHFATASAGTIAAGAMLDIIPRSNPSDPLAYALTLDSVEIAEDLPTGLHLRLLQEDLYLTRSAW